MLRAAVELADRGGIEAVSMRKLGQELGVEAMALYRHFRNKGEILDGIIDSIVGEIVVEDEGAPGDWKSALRNRIMTARQVMLSHPWAPGLIEERRNVGPAILRYIDGVLATLRGGGFSLDMTHHSLHVLGSRILGFTQDLFNDSEDARTTDPEAAAAGARAMAALYPSVGEMALAVSHDGGLGGCDDDFEFVFGLDLILDGLEQRRDRS